jgi:hypothetical protein
MIMSDKELIEALLTTLENFYVEHVLALGQLRRARAAGFHDSADKTGLEAAALVVREVFRTQYAQAIRSEQELRAFLEALPTSESVQ